jgi:hypothetical protein
MATFINVYLLEVHLNINKKMLNDLSLKVVKITLSDINKHK